MATEVSREIREKEVSFGVWEWKSTLKVWAHSKYEGEGRGRLLAAQPMGKDLYTYLFEIIEVPLMVLARPVSWKVCGCLVAHCFWADFELLTDA